MQRKIPSVVFVVVAAIGLGMVSVVGRSEDEAAKGRFEIVADDAADRIRERVQQHIALLIATSSFLEATDNAVSRDAFRKFVTNLNLTDQFRGLQGIGFARLLRKGSDGAVTAELRKNYGIDRQVWPETQEDYRAAIVLLEPIDARNEAALGYDMFSETTRREAMLRVMATGEIQASGVVQLVQEITTEKQAGFLVYLPQKAVGLRTPDAPAFEGFVYAPFRAGDLHEAALGTRNSLPIVVETRDTSDGADDLLFKSPDFDTYAETAIYSVTRMLQVGGRTWTINIHETPGFRSSIRNFYSFVVSLISILLATTMALAVRWFIQSLDNAHKLHAVSEQTIKAKDLMLQEMKHRIKNSIARILAISRQTAATSGSLGEYNETFAARLQSMASAQDMLTRSTWQRADLKALLAQELEQVAGALSDRWSISGEPIELDERTTQALGLTFHELTTNSLKYGAGAADDGRIAISWRVRGSGRKRQLEITWAETGVTVSGQPNRQGFGTRLIDANIRGDLGGSIDRDFMPDGLTVRMTVPLA